MLQLLVSELGNLPPCIYLTQYWKDKDCSPLEWSGVNVNLNFISFYSPILTIVAVVLNISKTQKFKIIDNIRL